MGEKTYQLTRNCDGNNMHGGFRGFSFRVWDSEILEDTVRFTPFSPQEEEGYPGNLRVQVTCRLTEEDGLHYMYDAVSDADTVVNMTCHAYFNLEGHNGGSVLSHRLQSPAKHCRTEAPAGMPKAEVFPVAGTPFDFSQSHELGRDRQVPHLQLDPAYGYDRNLYLGAAGAWKRAALVEAPRSGIAMEVRTTQTGMQLYCPGIPLEAHPGKNGVTYEAYGAFCIETQHCLSPQEAGRGLLYPVLPAGIPYHAETVYRFAYSP